jgi:hypothetical protein
VDDSGHPREGPVEDEVGRRVRRGPERTLDDRTTIQVDDDHRVGTQPVVPDPARLDRHHAGVAVERAGVAEGEHDEPGAHDLAVGLERALAQLGVRGRH